MFIPAMNRGKKPNGKKAQKYEYKYEYNIM